MDNYKSKWGDKRGRSSYGMLGCSLHQQFRYISVQVSKMKEAVVDKATKVTLRDIDIPVAKPGQVLIKVIVSGTNPKDWKLPAWLADVAPYNQGDDIAGYVEAVGDGVTNFKKGDKVAAFHQMQTAGGSYAEYAIAWEHTTFHVPEKINFEGMISFPELLLLLEVFG